MLEPRRERAIRTPDRPRHRAGALARTPGHLAEPSVEPSVHEARRQLEPEIGAVRAPAALDGDGDDGRAREAGPRAARAVVTVEPQLGLEGRWNIVSPAAQRERDATHWTGM